MQGAQVSLTHLPGISTELWEAIADEAAEEFRDSGGRTEWVCAAHSTQSDERLLLPMLRANTDASWSLASYSFVTHFMSSRVRSVQAGDFSCSRWTLDDVSAFTAETGSARGGLSRAALYNHIKAVEEFSESAWSIVDREPVFFIDVDPGSVSRLLRRKASPLTQFLTGEVLAGMRDRVKWRPFTEVIALDLQVEDCFTKCAQEIIASARAYARRSEEDLSDSNLDSLSPDLNQLSE